MPVLASDGAAATDGYSIAENRLYLDGLPIVGIGNVTGGGIKTDGMNHTRGAQGQILDTSTGISTPEDLTIEMTVGTWKQFRAKLTAAALLLGVTGDDAYRHPKFSLVRQFGSSNPLAAAYTITYTLRVANKVEDMPNDGSNAKITIVCKQTALPQET